MNKKTVLRLILVIGLFLGGCAQQDGEIPLLESDAVPAVNEVVTSIPGSQVGTVGKISAQPGAHNVIPGRVTTGLEIRDLSREKIWSLYEKIRDRVKRIEKESGTKFNFTQLGVSAVPAIMAQDIQEMIRQVADDLGLSWKSMPSGAGHDAQDMARIAPTGMIFVPSEGGNPRIALAAALLLDVAGSPPATQQTDSRIGPATPQKILEEVGSDDETITRVCDIVRCCHSGEEIDCIEFRIVRDADTLATLSSQVLTTTPDEWTGVIENRHIFRCTLSLT